MTKWITARTEEQLIAAATTLFTANFEGVPAGVWAAPGRVNLIGEHVDYAGGVSIPFALEHSTAVAVSPRADGQFHIVTDMDPDNGVMRYEVPLDQVGPGNPANWAGYAVGAVWAACAAGVIPSCTGLNIAVTSDVPVGSGLSSSAALECSTAVAAFELATGHAPDDAARAQLVQACIRAENEVVGASTGGLDQNTSIFAQAGKALVIDFSTGEITHVPFELAQRDMVLLIADTNAPHSLNDGQYASRRGVIDEVQAALAPGGTIRDVPAAIAAATEWASATGRDAALVRRRVAHVVEETARTLIAADALQAGDLEHFAQLMRDSHLSMRDQYEITTPELDSAFEAAGEYGARLTGGGFGGAVIVLTHKDKVQAVADNIAAAAAAQGFPAPTFLLALPGPGARRIF